MTSHEGNVQNTSQSSGSGTTGPGSFLLTEEYRDNEMDDLRDESKSEGCVDQGAYVYEVPRTLYTSGDEPPRTGYEPKPSSMDENMVGGRRLREPKPSGMGMVDEELQQWLNEEDNQESFGKFVTSTVSVHSADWERENGQETFDVPKPSSMYQNMDNGNYQSETAYGHIPMSTASVQCAGWESGYDYQADGNDDQHPETFNMQYGLNSSQGEYREYGTEIADLEEKIQELDIKGQRNYQAVYNEMIKFSMKEDMEAVQRNLDNEVTTLKGHVDEWRHYFDGTIQTVNDKFKECIMVNEFQSMFDQITSHIKSQETHLAEETTDLEETIKKDEIGFGQSAKIKFSK